MPCEFRTLLTMKAVLCMRIIINNFYRRKLIFNFSLQDNRAAFNNYATALADEIESRKVAQGHGKVIIDDQKYVSSYYPYTRFIIIILLIHILRKLYILYLILFLC